jgi:hypothetical protein
MKGKSGAVDPARVPDKPILPSGAVLCTRSSARSKSGGGFKLTS